MTTEQIETQTRATVAELLEIESEEITADSKFKDDLGMDSLDMTDLIMALEEEFSIQIGDEEANRVTTFQEAVDLVEKTIKEDQRA